MKRLSSWLHKISTGWVTLLALVIYLIFSATVLPAQSSKAEAISGGSGAPDLSFFYSPADLYRWAEAYGVDGRQAFVQARWTFDLVYPLVYGLFLVTAISWLFRRGFPAGSKWQLANLTPVLAVVFDFLENSAASIVMLRFPAQTPVVDFLSPIFTSLKWIFVAGSILSVLVGLVAALLAALRRKH